MKSLTREDRIDHKALQGLIAKTNRAVDRELSLERKTGYRAAALTAQRLEHRLRKAAEAAAASPVETFDDLVALAEIAQHLRPARATDRGCLDDTVLSAVARGVLELHGSRRG